MSKHSLLAFALLAGFLASPALAADAQTEAPLPAGVKAVWDIEKAIREKTATRERICINGLWRWQPARETNTALAAADTVPAGKWGFFKVPGCWPGIQDYMQKDCQTVFAHPDWKSVKLAGVSAAWYQREITIPADWTGRRITLRADTINSLATVFIDGKRAGEIRFPGGELDITAHCKPGGKHLLSLYVTALPLKAVMISYGDTASSKEVKGTVNRRGLCGDVWLESSPAGPRITDVRVRTSTRKGQVELDVAMEGLVAEKEYHVDVRFFDAGKDGNCLGKTGKMVKGSWLRNGRIDIVEDGTEGAWRPEALWDIHTPQNQFRAELRLEEFKESKWQTLDQTLPIRFGFREFWIDGRDFYLNGSRIWLSSVPLDSAQVGAAWASYEGAKESLLRLKAIGINMVYTHNYGCEPGTHLGFEEILRAADDVGMLVSFSMPHFGQYDWKAPDADANNGYAKHAEYYVRAAQNHPSVVFYSMSHNGCGYPEDMNPDWIDGRPEPRDQWSGRNVKMAERAEAIVKALDPGRIVYHHAGGNTGSVFTINFYPNMVPIQEMSDWFEHWSKEGNKPLFTCEYGAPFTWDWAMYRGWYKGVRTFGSATVPWELCLAEWNAQFLGDRAYKIGEAEKKDLRWEAKQSAAGKLWHRWDYPFELGSNAFDDRYEVLGKYISDNWPAFRAWGLSGNSPWEYAHFWKPREGVDRSRKELKTDWETIQRPGFSPDYIDGRYEKLEMAFERSDWEETPAASSLLSNNRPFLGFVAGEPNHLTEKSHNFLPGEELNKQLIFINNFRMPVNVESSWMLNDEFSNKYVAKQIFTSNKTFKIETGMKESIPISIQLPRDLTPGPYVLYASIKPTVEGSEEDQLRLWGVDKNKIQPRFPKAAYARQDVYRESIHVLNKPSGVSGVQKVALFDPNGETAGALKGMGVAFDKVGADADLKSYDILVIGKHALSVSGAAPDLSRVREGLKVIVFEQSAEAMEKRLGFRTVEYGLRQVWPRVPDHPILRGLEADHLRDWRGAATNTPPRLALKSNPKYNYQGTVEWCGLELPHLWRCGNWGSVASVLIEKPPRGDWLPIVDGGYSLQYSPLMEYREGKGLVLFCQLDVTGRTESDPAAETIARNILTYVSAWKPGVARKVVYAGEPAGKEHLAKAGFAPADCGGGKIALDELLVLGPGAAKKLSGGAAAIADHLKAGGCVVAVGLEESEAKAVFPFEVKMTKAEHIASFFEPPKRDSRLEGVGPADVHNRDPRVVPLIAGGANEVGDGVLATAWGRTVTLCQLVPWQFDYSKDYHPKRTFRRASFLLSRLLANQGATATTPLLERFKTPVDTKAKKPEARYLDGLYLDQPEEWDDPYRSFRW